MATSQHTEFSRDQPINLSTSQPINLSTSQLINYTLHLADNALVLGHRNSEWCGHGPVLEQDIAITNISLDLIGQARNFYQYAAKIINDAGLNPGHAATEDTLAYFRDAKEFKNCLLTELPRGDWAFTILRQFFFSQYQYLLYKQLEKSQDEQLAAIAEKSLKEVTYHLRWSSEWVIRLGDSTKEANQRMLKATDDLWMFTGEFFKSAKFEKDAVSLGFGVDVEAVKNDWMQAVKNIFQEATLALPDENAWMQTGGKTGRHTEHLGFILADMQYLQKTYPGNEW